MREFTIEFPLVDTKVRAVMLDNPNTALADSLWNQLQESSRMFCHHTGSTGGLIIAYPIPSMEFPLLKPVETLMICNDGYPGLIAWSGGRMMLLHSPCTEPLISDCGPVAKVVDEDLDAYRKACMDVWYNLYFHHKLATIVVARKDV